MIKRYKIIVLILIGVFCTIEQSAAQTSDEWTIFRGNPQLCGASNAVIKLPLELKWTLQTNDAIVSAPVVGSNTIFIGSVDGMIYAIDFEGNVKWKHKTDNAIEAPALYLNGRIYVGNLSGKVFALDADTGQLIWVYETKGNIIGSTNYFTNGKKSYLLVGSYDYYLHCIDAQTGKGIWKYESNNYINGAAAVNDGLAYFGGCDGYLHMVDLASGSLHNKQEVATYIAGSTAIYDGLAYTGDYDGLFTCIDIVNKEIRWQWDNPSNDLPFVGSPSIADKRVVIGGQDKYVRCFNKASGELIWSFNAGGRIDASTVIAKEKVIVVTMDGMIYILDLVEGKNLWSYEIGSSIVHNPAIIDGKIIVGARDGNIYYFEN